MDAEALWTLFYLSGQPIFYTLYCQVKREEEAKEQEQIA